MQELLRHSSSKMILDVYAQALTPTNRAAQRKVVAMIREDLSVPRSMSFNVLGVVGIVCECLAQDRHCNVNPSFVVHEGVVRPKDLPYS